MQETVTNEITENAEKAQELNEADLANKNIPTQEPPEQKTAPEQSADSGQNNDDGYDYYSGIM